MMIDMTLLGSSMTTLADTGDMISGIGITVVAVALLAVMAVSAFKGNNPWWKPALITLVLAVCIYMLYPIQEKLRLGIDLRGGTSLLYEVDTSDSDNANNAIKRSISVIQNRIDPSGNANIQITQEGVNRLQFMLPQATPAVIALRDEYRDATEDLLATNLTGTQVLQALRKTGEDRQAALNELVRGIETRQPIIADLPGLYDASIKARDDYANAQDGTDAKILAAFALSEADKAYRARQNDLLATNIDMQRVVSALRLSDEKPEIDEDDENVTEDDKLSSREREFKALRETYPEHLTLLNTLIEKFITYNEESGSLDDANDLIRLLRGAGVLQFHIAVDPANPGGIDINEFRTRLAEKGPNAFGDERAKWYVLKNQNENFGHLIQGVDSSGRRYALLWDISSKRLAKDDPIGWAVTSATASQDESGFPAVSFSLNAVGASKMQSVTKNHVGQPLSVVLDGELYSAPNINSPLSGNIQVTGDFSDREVQFMLRTLNAGAMDVTLSEEPISTRVIGPSLGEGNRSAGLYAALFSLIAVAIFMMIYYFFAGAIANSALLANIVVILGVMSMTGATFTLPGIAGIVLTIGMCVDANVLIFERVREELEAGRNTGRALQLGYQKAFSSIIDGNLTNLLVCAILFFFTTADVKGFATTLAIGIGATLFTSLFMTRAIFEIYDRLFGLRKIAMLPVMVPGIAKLLRPNVPWLKLRPVFAVVSALVIITSVASIALRGEGMLDIEFRGGTEVAFKLKQVNPEDTDPNAERITMSRSDVADMVHMVGEWSAGQAVPAEHQTTWDTIQSRRAERIDQRIRDFESEQQISRARRLAELGDNAENRAELDQEFSKELEDYRKLVERETDLKALAGAIIQELGEKQGDNVSEFAVRTTVPDAPLVAGVVTTVFRDKLQIEPALSFEGENNEIPEASMYMAVEYDTLGETLADRKTGLEPSVTQVNTSDYKGGVVFLIENVKPGATENQVYERIKSMRQQPDFATIPYRDFRVVGVERFEGDDTQTMFSSFAILVKDDSISAFDNRRGWLSDLVNPEWALINAALHREKSLDKVSNFTGVVAASMTQAAITALLLSLLAIVAYIWFRFGSLRYGLAAIAALVHDVTIALGLVAIAGGFLYETPLRDVLLLEPFSINMGLIAALLTIIGYSLNDTIVLFDRIRENRGKLSFASKEIINASITQTISRTILTSFTTFLAVAVLYIAGGEGIRGFAFCLLIGVIVGTYSSIAIACPLLLVGLWGKTPTVVDEEEDGESTPVPAEPSPA